jgi:hypothetical protein
MDTRPIPGRAHKKRRLHKNRVLRNCSDQRAYVEVPFTIKGDLVVGDYAPMHRAGRDYYIARVHATVGRHNSATHPDDGTASGQPIRVNVRRILADESADAAILGTDNVISIASGKHKDTSVNDHSDFNIDTLHTGDTIYVRVIAVGSGRPGTHLNVTVVLVPVRGHL